VKLLLNNKADANASRHTASVTPVYVATKKQVVRQRLGKKAEVEVHHADGDKPIDAARRNRHFEIVKLLQ